MIAALRLMAISACLLFLASCTEAGATHTDPNGLVAFSVPGGWAEKDRSNGIRFVRADAPKERTVLQVSARARDPGRGVEEQRASTQAAVKAQGFRLVIDQARQINGWEAWESGMDATPARGGDGPMKHTYHLFSKNVQAEVTLMAKASDYPGYREDLLAVVQSLREN